MSTSHFWRFHEQVAGAIIWISINTRVLSEENIKRRIDALLDDLQEKTGVSDEDMDEFKKIMELADFSQDQE